MNTKRSVAIIILWLAAGMFSLIFAAANNLQKDDKGITIETPSGLTRLEVWRENVIRVLHSPAPQLPRYESMAVVFGQPPVQWQVQDKELEILLTTAKLQVRREQGNRTRPLYGFKRRGDSG